MPNSNYYYNPLVDGVRAAIYNYECFLEKTSWGCLSPLSAVNLISPTTVWSVVAISLHSFITVLFTTYGGDTVGLLTSPLYSLLLRSVLYSSTVLTNYMTNLLGKEHAGTVQLTGQTTNQIVYAYNYCSVSHWSPES